MATIFAAHPFFVSHCSKKVVLWQKRGNDRPLVFLFKQQNRLDCEAERPREVSVPTYGAGFYNGSTKCVVYTW